ncbi:hypothetical protein [Cellulomonas sp. KRMCY2]|uniref:hypothetical protein n=1 Tax=Cellulomonas sp. KRMCY2 TaxID=1304865 RepID=UPI00045EA609|nr:hypothetical protein [Cellulomonas sp. KRMCY2]
MLGGAADLGEGALVGGLGLFVVQGGVGVVELDVVALDAVGPLDGTRERGAAQAAGPPTRHPQPGSTINNSR